MQNSAADYEAAVRAIHDRGIMINASFVFGLDGDTAETFDATLDWIVQPNRDSNLAYPHALPGNGPV